MNICIQKEASKKDPLGLQLNQLHIHDAWNAHSSTPNGSKRRVFENCPLDWIGLRKHEPRCRESPRKRSSRFQVSRLQTSNHCIMDAFFSHLFTNATKLMQAYICILCIAYIIAYLYTVLSWAMLSIDMNIIILTKWVLNHDHGCFSTLPPSDHISKVWKQLKTIKDPPLSCHHTACDLTTLWAARPNLADIFG